MRTSGWYATRFHAHLKHMTRSAGLLEKHLKSTARMTRKNVITALMTQRYQAVNVVVITTYNVPRSHTNCSERNQIFTVPTNACFRLFSMFSRIHFELLCLSPDEVKAHKENQYVIVYVWINFSLGACLSGRHLGPLCVCAPDWARQPCTISCNRTHSCTQKEGDGSNASVLEALSNVQTFPQPSNSCHAKL